MEAGQDLQGRSDQPDDRHAEARARQVEAEDVDSTVRQAGQRIALRG